MSFSFCSPRGLGFVVIVILSSGFLLACSGGKTAGSSTAQGAKCPAGEVKVAGVCRNVCAQLSECDFSEICNADGVCLAPANGALPPRITSINGDGSMDGVTDSRGVHADNHIKNGLAIVGGNLSGVTASLTALDAGLSNYASLTVRSEGSDTDLFLDLPASLQQGKYTLTISNQSGNAEAMLYVLQGEKGVNGADGVAGPAGATGLAGPAGSASVTGTEWQLLFIKKDGSNSGDGQAQGAEIYYTSAGELGIGTATPAGKLHVHDEVVLGFGATVCPGYYIMTNDADGNGIPSAGDTCSADNLVVKADGKVGIGTTSPTARLDVGGTIKADGQIESTTGGIKFPNGTIQTSAGKIINVTNFTDCTRVAYAASNQFIMATFDVNKLSANSVLLIEGTISGFGNASGSMQQIWTYGNGTDFNAQGIMYENTIHGKVFPTRVVISGHTTTGIQSMLFTYKAMDNDTANRPFLIYNPNATDDTRLGQTCSVYTVMEIAQ